MSVPIENIVYQTREAFIELVDSDLQTLESTDQDIYAAILLLSAVNGIENLSATAVLGGCGGKSGYRDDCGYFQPHYWVQVSLEEVSLILDITADLFCGQPTTVLPLNESSKIYTPAEQADTDKIITRFKRIFDLG